MIKNCFLAIIRDYIRKGSEKALAAQNFEVQNREQKEKQTIYYY